ncbi:hypothetical protein JHK85_051375 [Glycine max]|nr:hypothetical protein JHK85_051375 [Glycine max]
MDFAHCSGEGEDLAHLDLNGAWILRVQNTLINEAYCEDFDIGNGHYCIMGWPSTNFYDSTQPYLDIVEAKEYLQQKGVDVSSS